MTAVALSAYQRGALPLSSSTGRTLGMWDLAQRHQHLQFWQTIREIQARLAPLGAEIAVIKGVATEARWYDELGERPCTDVDIFLAPDALADSARVVSALDPARGCDSTIDWLVRRRLLQHVDLRVGNIAVDLHFDPLKIGLPTRQLDEVWSSTQMLPTPHGTVRVLRPEVELVLLLLHLNRDRFALLGPFLDIRRIVDRADLDWAYLLGFVAEEGLQVPVWKSLAAVAEVLCLAIDVPPVGRARGRTWDRLWGGHARLQGDDGRQRARRLQMFINLHATGRARENLSELRRQLAPPRQLFEVAGSLRPGQSYVQYFVFGRFRPGAANVRLSRDAAC